MHSLSSALLAPHSPTTLSAPLPPPLLCPSPRCNISQYTIAGDYIQHLKSRHRGEGAHSFHRSGHLTDIITCCDCGQFCLNATGLNAHRRLSHKVSAVVSLCADEPVPDTAPPPLSSSFQDPAPPDILGAGQDLSREELLDLFQLPSLYDIHRAWRAPLFRIVHCLFQKSILEGLVAVEETCNIAW